MRFLGSKNKFLGMCSLIFLKVPSVAKIHPSSCEFYGEKCLTLTLTKNTEHK